MLPRNPAVELLRKILSGGIRSRRRTNAVQARSFADILRKHGYPTDRQEEATQTVLDPAEALSLAWAA
jgi:hypothetical protein